MPEPQFVQVGGSDLFRLDASLASGFGVYFLAAPGSGWTGNVSVETVWASPAGAYLFFNGALADPGALIVAVRALMAGPGYAQTRFLWIRDATLATSPLAVNRLRAAPSGASWIVLQTEGLRFADYQLRVGAACSLGGPTAANGFGFTITPGTLALRGPAGSWATPSATVPFSGAAIGCLQCNFQLAPGDLAPLRIGGSYYLLDDEQPDLGFVRALDCPVLAANGPFTVYGSFDPINPLDGDRTALDLFDPAGVGPAPPAFASTFVSARGWSVTLTPARGSGGEPDARFVFALRPMLTDLSVERMYQLAPEGPFAVTVNPPSVEALPVPAERLVGGVSGVEYLGLMSATGNILHFIAGPNALAYAAGVGASPGANQPLLTALGTTAWVYVTPPPSGAIDYYAQPDESLLYAGGASPGLLDFLEVPIGTLPAAPSIGRTQPYMFPMLPYSGLTAAQIDDCISVESQAISPARRAAVGALLAPPQGPLRASVDGETTGVTPQGLVAAIDDTSFQWNRLTLAQTPAAGDAGQLQLTGVHGPLQAVFQSNQLFLVAADAATFLGACSVRYQLTSLALDEIQALPPLERGSDADFALIEQGTAGAGYPIYDDLDAYDTQLKTWAPGIAAFLPVWREHGALFEIAISGFRFRVSPYQWVAAQRQEHKNTILLVKYGSGTLDELARDTSRWPWPEVAKIDGNVGTTQKEILSIFDAARAALKQGNQSFKHFVGLLDDEYWNGVLLLNCDVPLDDLPPQLQGLAAGIDPTAFYAHHVGFDTTPLAVNQGVVQLGATAFFGLIEYEDLADQVFAGDDYAFKVQRLTVLFQNSAIRAFNSRIELMINRLFGALATRRDGDHGNNILLEGVYQKQDGKDTYSFNQVGGSVFDLAGSALLDVSIDSAQFLTAVSSDSGQVNTRFLMGGRLRFVEPSDFDPFSYGPPRDGAPIAVEGYLQYANLWVSMDFARQAPAGKKTFHLRADQMRFDLDRSQSRNDGLSNKFPVTFSGLIEQTGALTPADLGYLSVGAPVDMTPMTSPWYGLTFDLDLGTLGALGASTRLTLSVLAAWCPGPAPTGPPGDPGVGVAQPLPPIYVGVKLPFSGGFGSKWPIESILSLGFRSMQFIAGDKNGERFYMLRMRRFALTLFGVSLPPGNNDIYLFGNPDNTTNSALGWYACYSMTSPGGG